MNSARLDFPLSLRKGDIYRKDLNASAFCMWKLQLASRWLNETSILCTIRLDRRQRCSVNKLTYFSISSPSSLLPVKASAAQDVEMFTSSSSAEQQRELAKKVTSFLSCYSSISDSYIIVRIYYWLLPTVCHVKGNLREQLSSSFNRVSQLTTGFRSHPSAVSSL